MGNARKCDRCGRCFDPLEEFGCMTRFRNPTFQDAENLKENKVGSMLIPGQPDAFVDLCPECTTEFFIFMHRVPKKRETRLAGKDYDGDGDPDEDRPWYNILGDILNGDILASVRKEVRDDG